jgi:hypothetical protein
MGSSPLKYVFAIVSLITVTGSRGIRRAAANRDAGISSCWRDAPEMRHAAQQGLRLHAALSSPRLQA